jgi:hypothetical protein
MQAQQTPAGDVVHHYSQIVTVKIWGGKAITGLQQRKSRSYDAGGDVGRCRLLGRRWAQLQDCHSDPWALNRTTPYIRLSKA